MKKITCMGDAATEINRLQSVCRNQMNSLTDSDKKIGEMQAQIDRLMMEFCPDEMTAEQRANWEKHQRKT